MSKRINKNKTCDCRDCENAGPVNNYMVECSKSENQKSIGKRRCEYFTEKDVRQDNNESNR